MKPALAIFFAIMVLTCAGASAEIEKVGVPCPQGGELCLAYWPRLPTVQGWHHEEEASRAHGINAQAPDGTTFADAETVIYARALYKPDLPDKKSLDTLIQEDKKEFQARDPGLEITEVEPLKTADGQSLRSFTFFPKGIGNWERVSYGEEGDFYLIISISSRTKEGLAKNSDSYLEFVNGYREKPK